MTETRRRCPYCAEDIAAEAVRCPHCRSRLLALEPGAWHRDHPERRLAGVAAALARALAVPVVFVRTAFVLLTFVHFLGVLAYGALWTLIPRRPGEPSPFDRLAGRVRAEVDRFRTGTPSVPPAGSMGDRGGAPAADEPPARPTVPPADRTAA